MEIYIVIYDCGNDREVISFVASYRSVAELHLDFICKGMNEEYRKLYKIERHNVITRDDYHIKKMRKEICKKTRMGVHGTKEPE